MSPKNNADPQKTQTRKQQILESAGRLFAEQGYYKTTTADVARDVGVTQPYVFHFFKNKESLYLAVLEIACERINQAFTSVDASRETLWIAMGCAFQDLLEDSRHTMLLAMQAYTTPEPAVREFARSQFKRIYTTVRERFEQARLEKPGLLASQFVGTGLILSLSEILELPELSPWEDAK